MGEAAAGLVSRPITGPFPKGGNKKDKPDPLLLLLLLSSRCDAIDGSRVACPVVLFVTNMPWLYLA